MCLVERQKSEARAGEDALVKLLPDGLVKTAAKTGKQYLYECERDAGYQWNGHSDVAFTRALSNTQMLALLKTMSKKYSQMAKIDLRKTSYLGHPLIDMQTEDVEYVVSFHTTKSMLIHVATNCVEMSPAPDKNTKY
jgi:hypothetical protein